MKKILLSFSFSVLIITSVVSQNSTKVRYINVLNDKNIIIHTKPEFCTSCSDQIFVLDGNESLGYVELNFSGINSFSKAKAIILIMNVADVEWAESGNGFSVFFNNEKIGSISNLSRNSCFSIDLNVSKIAGNKNIKLVLKANGDDGLYLLSKKSGFGAVLKLQY